jgi:membrane-associated protease RseP (regulator of RpoE activity)
MTFCVGLSVFNMRPIAPFDGGAMLIYTVKEIFGPGWPVTLVTVIGFIMFAGLVIYITVQDIIRVWISRSR